MSQGYEAPADYTAINQPLEIMFNGSHTTISATWIDSWMRESGISCTVFGVHIGAAAITAIILALLTKPNKRRTPVFILNEISLFLVILRAGLYINYVLGPFNTFGAYFSGDYSEVPYQALVRSSVTAFLQLLITFGVELSLLFQVRIVFDTHRRLQRIITAGCSVLVVIVMAFWLVAIVQNIGEIMQAGEYQYLAWAWTTAKALYAASISIFSGIFCFKLVLAIRQRRVLGLTEFGPLQVIVIMTTQTMIVPAVITIVELATNSGIVLSALPSLIVVLSLPLSALWASATNDAIGASRRSGNGSNINNVNMSGGTSSTHYSDQYMFKNNTTTSTSGASSTNIDLEKQEEYQYKGPAVTVTRTIVAE
ncbi:fungal pheromone mating factor STE2 GPCR-domain-containing protein [Lipomyces tetrasporus]|uniref:Fungal pheromone mating factor STE2 GPCR-domain-containing protein n=1 Tax=Lipomyces tetrasporus TaxID=54092 RepID=A0AAD7VV48_9ASCO|nr:fungal pheromone mating factor STE2 GPCR-domain-containing protein [Lipomyces tetrasporus]KAJ8103133.1 fungal pheromone mating factor STE2 GPCR-domain-containing protein [Lipomyces tetrasporus]